MKYSKKDILIFFYLVLIPHIHVFGQQFTVTTKWGNMAYLGLANPLSTFVEGHKCNDIFLATDNGSLSRNQQGSRYYDYSPSSVGEAKITVSVKSKKIFRKVGVIFLHVEKSPEPIAFIANKRGGRVSSKFLVIQSGILVKLPEYLGIDFTGRVNMFTTIILRNDTLLFSRKNSGNRFDPETTQAITQTKTGDLIDFIQIKGTGTDGTEILLRPLEFTIDESLNKD